MSSWLLIYLAAGVVSRAVFFIYDAAMTKKYNLHKYEPFSFVVELLAHALDVVGWPFATVASFYLINKEIKKTKGE